MKNLIITRLNLLLSVAFVVLTLVAIIFNESGIVVFVPVSAGALYTYIAWQHIRMMRFLKCENVRTYAAESVFVGFDDLPRDVPSNNRIWLHKVMLLELLFGGGFPRRLCDKWLEQVENREPLSLLCGKRLVEYCRARN
jgi:hypothetical protein